MGLTAHHEIGTSKVWETWCANTTPVRSVGTVRDKVDTHLALRCLNGGVGLAGRDTVAFRENLEVVDETFHALLHAGTRRRHELVVVDLDSASGHLVEALVDNAQTFTELLHTAQVTVVAVAIASDGNVKLDLVIRVVRRDLAQIPWNTTSTEHDTSERVIEGLFRGDLAHVDCASFPNTVAGHDLFNLVDTAAELSGPHVDVLEQTMWEVEGDTAGADIGGVQTGARDAFVKLHELLALLETPEERSETTDVHDVGEDSHKMVQDTRELAKERADPFGALGNLDVEELLHGERVRKFICHYQDSQSRSCRRNK